MRLEVLTRTVRHRCGHKTFAELAPVASHHSVGAMERANKKVAIQAGEMVWAAMVRESLFGWASPKSGMNTSVVATMV